MQVGTRRILIVENDIDALSVIYTTLLPLNYAIEAAVDANELRPRIERFDPELLLLGESIRKEKHLCDWIKKNYKACVMGIGTSTAQNENAICLDGIITKPVDPVELLTKINYLLPV